MRVTTEQDTYTTLAHEGFHAHVNALWGPTGALPFAVDEGLAATFEPATPDGRGGVWVEGRTNARRARGLARVWREGRPMSLAELLAADAGRFLGDPEAADAFYAQAWALIGFLRAERAGVLRRLAASAAAGRDLSVDGPAALEAALGVPLASVEPAWRAYCERAAGRVPE